MLNDTLQMTKKFLISIFIFSILYSCDTKQNSAKPESKPDSSDKSIGATTANDLTRASNFYQHIYIKNKTLTRQVKIDSLNYHFDSLQIRLWNTGGLFQNHQLYLITNKNSIWSGTYFNLQPDTNYINGQGSNEFLKGPMPLEIKRMKSVKPKLGWAKFVDSLLSLNIMTLPDTDEVPKMKVTWTDASSTIIEVSTHNKYRFYSYYSPEQFVDSFWQAQKVVSIQSLFYTELLR